MKSAPRPFGQYLSTCAVLFCGSGATGAVDDRGRVLGLRGPAGQTVTVRHAEVLDQDGNFYTDNLRAAGFVAQV